MEVPSIDFVAYKPDGSVVLLAEAKSRRGTSEAWAAKLRRNMMSHGVLPESEFFLIATPDRIYGWKQQNLPASEVPPQFQVDAEKALRPYLGSLEKTHEGISPSAFELVVLKWLTDISEARQEELECDSSLDPLVSSGLISSLNDARIEPSS